MKLVEKKCPNCGANIKFNSENNTVTCNYCNTIFDIERDLDQEIKEEVILRFKEQRKISKTALIFIFLVFITVTIIIIVMFTRMSNSIPRLK